MKTETINILKKHAPELLKEPAFQENPILLQQIQKAMLEYAILFYCKATGNLARYETKEASVGEHSIE